MDQVDISGWILFYFRLGFRYKEILLHLKNTHRINMTLITLKRRLKQMNLKRRDSTLSSLDDIINFLMRDNEGPNVLHGYRWAHLRCLMEGYTVSRETVRNLQRLINPAAVEARKSNRLKRREYNGVGPNFLWHIDGNDKLKPYGICLHGAIDGYSRYILWIEASSTNKDPRVVGHNFFRKVQEIQGFPVTVRADRGTENGLIEAMQTVLSNKYRPGGHRPAFLYGKSPANQRIEAYWSFMKRHKLRYYMNFFYQMADEGNFEGNVIDKGLIQYCFLPLIKVELESLVLEWNTHRIRATGNNRSPGGRPMTLYFCPGSVNTTDYIVEIRDMQDVLAFERDCRELTYPCDEDLFHYCNLLSEELGLREPETARNAKINYLILRAYLYAELGA